MAMKMFLTGALLSIGYLGSMGITPSLSAEQEALKHRIEQKTGGKLYLKLRANTREQELFHVAYVLPHGVADQTPPDPERLGAVAWTAAETPEAALTGLAEQVGISS